ncbi:MAG: hypothetical protein IIZ61_05530 [Lachnospiraceae bacterium]|nr:hypothetical protein [Lachnospiraceae bacterium]
MPKFTIVLLIITAIVVGLTIALYFLGKKAEKKRAEQEEQIKASSQSVSMLIIDKKKMKLKEAGLPQQIVDQMPWYAKGSKVPVVKAKVGPKIMTMICEASIFDDVPVKKEVKANVSGIYITSVRGLHGKVEKAPEKKGIKGWFDRKMKEYKEGK